MATGTDKTFSIKFLSLTLCYQVSVVCDKWEKRKYDLCDPWADMKIINYDWARRLWQSDINLVDFLYFSLSPPVWIHFKMSFCVQSPAVQWPSCEQNIEVDLELVMFALISVIAKFYHNMIPIHPLLLTYLVQTFVIIHQRKKTFPK